MEGLEYHVFPAPVGAAAPKRGLCMSLCMTELGTANMRIELALALGILTGAAGLALVALAYPVYHRVLKRERARIAPEILRLTEELLK